MRYVGIICEYNPLHTGHAHLLEAVKGDSVVVCVMSGNFTQRGEAAILPPATRAAMAVAAGADVVLELPFPFAAASASYFATAGVRALAGVGVDTLAFGSETGEAASLTALADRLPEGNYREGAPESRGDAAAYFDALGGQLASNDILAVEYLRAIKREAPFLSVLPVLRDGAKYGETVLKNGEFPSATALRGALLRGEDVSCFIPPRSYPFLQEALDTCGIAETRRLGTAMLAHLRCGATSCEDSALPAACGGGLLQRLKKVAWEATDYESLCRLAATKRYTDGRIRRALLSLLAGVNEADLKAHPAYLRLLAASRRGREFLSATAKRRTVPVVTKQSEIAALGSHAARQRTLSLIADGLYAVCLDGSLSPHALQTAKPYLPNDT